MNHNIKPYYRNKKDLLCHDLPTNPNRNPGKILVTGASGYIGGRLLPELLFRGYKVRAMIRATSQYLYNEYWPNAEITVGDTLKVDQLRQALDGIDTAYYLIHSLNLGPKNFEIADIQGASNFRQIAEEKKLKHIIYLGGLTDIRNPLTPHLRNRMEVANELQKGKVPVTILRAAIIIGSGSASYEIIKNLVQNLPIIFIPRWAKNRCQPISVRDVIKYLVGVLEVPETSGKTFDIGGKEILTYEEMMKIIAKSIHKKRLFLPAFFHNISFYSYLASLLTPVPNAITRCLMEGLKNEVFCQNNDIRHFIPFNPISYKEAVVKALTREEQDNVYTRWSDAYPPAHELALKLYEIKPKINYTLRYSLLTEKSASSLFQSLYEIGGKNGWFYNNWMWRLRGFLDSILLGVGTSRGRKSFSSLIINDVIDFWRIEDLKTNERLLLRAEMKLPGKAWLEFKIEEMKDKRKLSVIPYYYTQSFFGKVYWYIFLPFHHFIFTHLIEAIEKRNTS